MTEIFISDKESLAKNLLYVQKNIAEVLRQTGSTINLSVSAKRAVLEIKIPDLYKDLIISEVADKIADVIAVGYKYQFFKSHIQIGGLSEDNLDLLITGIISADLDGDKKYVLSKLKGFEDMAIDGIYNFRLKLLKEKWLEIAEMLPPFFTDEQLKDFLQFIIKDKKARVYIDDNFVYDAHYRKLIKTELFGDKTSILKEIVLSGADEIRVLSTAKSGALDDLKEFYGDKITFSQKNK